MGVAHAARGAALPDTVAGLACPGVRRVHLDRRPCLRALRKLGLLVIKERWRQVGNLHRQISNLIALPLARPPERVKIDSHASRFKKNIQNMVSLPITRIKISLNASSGKRVPI